MVVENKNIQRGGGYGFNPAGKPGFGVMPIKTVNDCGTVKPDGLLGKQQHIHSPPPQRGGRKKGATASKRWW